MANKKKYVETIAVHGAHNDQGASSDIIQPIHLSTTFERRADGTLNDYVYSRAGNPNRLTVENKIAALEEAVTAISFSSGLAAVNALFENILEPGSHIIIPDDCYHGTRYLMDKFFSRWQVSFSETDMTMIENIDQLIQPNTDRNTI
jgi:cystathionine gamma-synthase